MCKSPDIQDIQFDAELLNCGDNFQNLAVDSTIWVQQLSFHWMQRKCICDADLSAGDTTGTQNLILVGKLLPPNDRKPLTSKLAAQKIPPAALLK